MGAVKRNYFFHYFDRLYMHAYLYEQELKIKAAPVYQKVTADVEKNRIEIISSKDLAAFAFYELLFLKYLSSEINLKEIHREFDYVTAQTMNRYPMKFRNRMMITVRRFSQNHGTERDYHWVEQYCKEKNIDYRVKMQKLKKYLANIE
jgi:hypothetical protein